MDIVRISVDFPPLERKGILACRSIIVLSYTPACEYGIPVVPWQSSVHVLS